MAHSLVMAGEICSVRQHGNQSERNLRRPCSCPTCTIRSAKLFLRKRSRLLELISSPVVAVPADYTRYLWTNCVSLGGIRRNCQARWHVRSAKTSVPSTIKSGRGTLLFRDVCNLRWQW